nr:MAG TPA: hypothetical protein [Caudoviricetes sp.]
MIYNFTSPASRSCRALGCYFEASITTAVLDASPRF